MDRKPQSKTKLGKARKQKQIGEQIQSGNQMDRKPQSKIKWERTKDKGRKNKHTSTCRVGARWMGSYRARQSEKSQREKQKQIGEQIQSGSQMDGKP
jgi:hypothetical protein